MGLPHSFSEDNKYMGYTIPADSIIIANYWQMKTDENIFENPVHFNLSGGSKSPSFLSQSLNLPSTYTQNAHTS